MGRDGTIKVIFCTDGIFPHSVGGMQRHSRMLIEALAATGAIEIVVLHPHPGERIFAAYPAVEEVALPPLPGNKHYFRELKDYSRLVMAELRKRPDHLVYSQGLSVWVDVAVVQDRLIVNPHGLEPFQALGLKDRLKTWPYRHVFRKLFRRAARVVSLGGSLTGILQRNGRPDHVVVLPNATRLLPQPAADLIKTPVRPLRFLFVGRFAYNKGIGVLLEAAQRLNAAGYQDRFVLDLAGKGPLFEEMKTRFPLPNVNFLGFVSDEDLDRCYLEDQVFVLPTLFEGMPTVVLEAMARAMPILVTDTGATLELVDGSNGAILPKNDVSGLQAAMQAMLDMPAAAFEAMSGASLRKVQERFTWDVVAQAHLALFRDMWHSS
jgi:glycosyltransferase involved in cell wall biosynthesis